VNTSFSQGWKAHSVLQIC